LSERSLDRLAEGEGGIVARMEDDESDEGLRLFSLGLAPGAQVRVEQTRPAVVVRVSQTVIAMEPAVARRVFVRPLPA
jgi:Fe2+ transport system protein FeoA